MNRRIFISVVLLAIALTIAGIAADGDTTPAVLAAAAELNAAQNPERAAPIEIECYSYICGKEYYTEDQVKINEPCKDKPEKTEKCHRGLCQNIVFKGTNRKNPVEYSEGGCAETTIVPEVECEELDGGKKYKRLFKGDARICMCNTTFCNGPKSDTSDTTSKGSGASSSNESSSSEVSSPIAFVTFAALFIAAKMKIF